MVRACLYKKYDYKCDYDGKIIYPILILVNYNLEMSKKGVLSFSHLKRDKIKILVFQLKVIYTVE